MGIIATNAWLEEDFERPIKMCEKLLPTFNGLNAKEIYLQLSEFGMYRPTKGAKDNFDWMKKNNVWKEAEQIFSLYKDKWAGPNIPIYLFPIGQERSLFSRQNEKVKGGVSYPDKFFLFLSDKIKEKDLEALLVHEYHHVCRLNKQNKNFGEYTLLDSIIMEGLAEYAVQKSCGKSYLAAWCSNYSESEWPILWEKYLETHLQVKKNERGHDERLYGLGRVPNLLGYTAGYKVVEKYYQKNKFSIKQSFSLPAENFIMEQSRY